MRLRKRERRQGSKGQEGAILLMEALIGLAILTITACIIAQYCFKITEIHHDIAQRTRMLNSASDILDAIIIHGSIPQEAIEREGITFTCKTMHSLPRIQTESVDIKQLPLKPYTLVTLTAQWQRASGEKRTYRITSAVPTMTKGVG